MPRKPITERFWSRVETSDGCWLWTGGIGGGGYGAFYFHGRQQQAHRVAWELTNGPIPDGMIICHHCDNRRCVRPDHLFLGTHRDNTDDMVAKGRQRQGANHPMHLHPEYAPRGNGHGRAKLTEDIVRIARNRYQRGERTITELARDYGVSDTAMGHAVKRKHWKHVL